MAMLRIDLRVIGLLAPEKWLAITFALANLALAGVYFLEPSLFGRVVDALAAKGHGEAWKFIGWWAGVGFGGIAASVWVSLHADRRKAKSRNSITRFRNAQATFSATCSWRRVSRAWRPRSMRSAR